MDCTAAVLLIYFLAYDIFMYSNPPYGYVKLWLLVQIALFLMLQSVTFLPAKNGNFTHLLLYWQTTFYFNNIAPHIQILK